MKNINGYGSVKVLKLAVLLMSMLFVSVVFAQGQSSDSKAGETQSDRDWKALMDTCSLAQFNASYREAVKKSLLEQLRFEDRVFQKCSQAAKDFWNKYPTDSRRDQALYQFFSQLAHPYFMPEKIPESQAQLFVDLPQSSIVLTRIRLGMVDHKARNEWLRTGDDMVATVLNSNASLERREAIEFVLVKRAYFQALNMRGGLPHVGSLRQGNSEENDFWVCFEEQYWQPILLRLENHVKKYAAVESVAEHVKSILDHLKNTSESSVTTPASDAYWAHFLKLTGADNPLSNKAGFKALHQMAADNVAAIELAKTLDYSKPLAMQFTAMDGSKVNLANMRGKVVLIDFWSTSCGPCIAEMPHLKAMYDKYRDKGFEVIGIAANGDEDKEDIQDILDGKNANWPQRLDNGANAPVSFHSLYGITSLPTVWLLNKEGIIVDRHARGDRLEPLIRQHLGLEKQ